MQAAITLPLLFSVDLPQPRQDSVNGGCAEKVGSDRAPNAVDAAPSYRSENKVAVLQYLPQSDLCFAGHKNRKDASTRGERRIERLARSREVHHPGQK